MRPTPAQLAILTRLDMGDESIICDEKFGNAWLAANGDDINQRTFDALIRNGLLMGPEKASRFQHYRISDAGRAEVSIARGAFRVAWPCGECKVPQPIQVRTYRECQRDGIGICCFNCAAKIFVAGEKSRQATEARP